MKHNIIFHPNKFAAGTLSRAGARQPQLVLAALAWTCLTLAVPAHAGDELTFATRGPELPTPECLTINAPEGAALRAHLYASGVQVYRWNGASWDFVAPEAVLYADPCHQAAIGLHYAGPTWELSDAGKITAVRQDGCTPSRGAIPWLLLGVTSAPEHGRLMGITHVQRVNTIGGTAPAEAGDFIGEEARVPYTAEYYFYRLDN